MKLAVLSLLILAMLAGCLSGQQSEADPETADSDNDGFTDAEEERRGSDPNSGTSTPITVANKGPGDAVVIAVVDGGFNPYHFDMLAEHMPQHRNSIQDDDLPLWDDPANWLPGHPGADAFVSYDRINITTTPWDDSSPSNTLYQDDGAWTIPSSSGDNVNLRWFPGTKVVGAVSFAGNPYAATSHGGGTSTVSVGNYHGSCPECLLVFVHGSSEQANEWVLKQDWIDAQTNSWGLSTGVRDRMYAGSDTDLQKTATERGHQIFFSAGNGQANTFTVPNPTLFSSQEGPDWIITVGAISPSDGSSYSGHGKPADIASLGGGYPSGAYCSNLTVNCTGNFGGTSNATPVVAGMYGKALYEIRREMIGVSRIQENGVISVGEANCLEANPDCAYADGNVTNFELRTALFRGAEYTPAGWSVAGAAPIPGSENSDELTFMAEGHGSYFARLNDDAEWTEEWTRIQGFANGAWYEAQDADQLSWFIADSICRQGAWGTWSGGYWDGSVTAASLADPQWPARTWLATQCPAVVGAVVTVEKIKDGG